MLPQQLSVGDSQILSHIFDPESSPSARIIIEDSLPSDPHITNSELLSTLKSRELEAIRLVEQASGANDEKKTGESFTKAYEIFSSLIQQYPHYASAFNNRAQLIRWRHGDQVLVRREAMADGDSNTKSTSDAISDLNTAIELATPSSPSSPLSPSQAKLLAQAHTQRATLFYTAAKLVKAEGGNQLNRAFETCGLERLEMLEESSSRDFFMGGRYGNEVSKAMAVHTNPYAKMCGAIVEEAMRKEFGVGSNPEKSEILESKPEA